MTTIFLSSGNVWQVPSDLNRNEPITVVAIGGGGSGGCGNHSCGGGGGGAFAQSELMIGDAEICFYSIGERGIPPRQAGPGGNGGHTWFNIRENSLPLDGQYGVLAAGGAGGNPRASSSAPHAALALGGQASDSLGQIRFSGGNGAGTGGTSSSGGGGSAASINGPGGHGRYGPGYAGGGGGGVGDLGAPAIQSTAGGLNHFGYANTVLGTAGTFGGGGTGRAISLSGTGTHGGSGFGYEVNGTVIGPGGGGGAGFGNGNLTTSGHGGLYGGGGGGDNSEGIDPDRTGYGAQGVIIIQYSSIRSDEPEDNIVHMDGFTMYSPIMYIDQVYTVPSSGLATQIVDGRYDGRALAFNDHNQSSTNELRRARMITKTFRASGDISFGFAFRRSAFNQNETVMNPWVSLENGYGSNYTGNYTDYRTMLAMVSTNVAGDVSLTLHQASKSVSYKIPHYRNTDWHYIEVEIHCGLTDGYARLYVDDEFAGGIDNIPIHTGEYKQSADRLSFSSYATSSSLWTYIDDLYITQTAKRIGEVHIPLLPPNADTAQKDFIPATATANYAQVRYTFSQLQTPSVESTHPGDRDLYVLGNIGTGSYTVGDIIAIQNVGTMFKTNLGSTYAAYISKVGEYEHHGTDLLLRDHSYTGSLVRRDTILVNNPQTGYKWTIDDIQNLEVGVKSLGVKSLIFQYLSSGQINNYTNALMGGTSKKPFNHDGVLTFNGDDQMWQYDNGTNNSAFNVTDPFSVEFEFNQTSRTNGAGSNTDQWIWSIGPNLVSGNPAMLVKTADSGNKLVLQYFNSSSDSGTELILSENVELGHWYHVGIMVYKSGIETRIRGYINNAQIFDSALVGAIKTGGSVGMSVGGATPPVPSSYFNGKIKKIKIGRSLFWKV